MSCFLYIHSPVDLLSPYGSGSGELLQRIDNDDNNEFILRVKSEHGSLQKDIILVKTDTVQDNEQSQNKEYVEFLAGEFSNKDYIDSWMLQGRMFRELDDYYAFEDDVSTVTKNACFWDNSLEDDTDNDSECDEYYVHYDDEVE